MAFRADEALINGYEEVKNFLIHKNLSTNDRQSSQEALDEIIKEIGPAVDAYPSWHPIVTRHEPEMSELYPSKECGYEGLDHTRYFVNGFITCPYGKGAQKIIESVQKFKYHPAATITAEILEVPFYSELATSVLVKCRWNKPLEVNNMIPKRLAIPMMLEQEVPVWHWSDYAEGWERMRPYLLGQPHGNRSSLFVSQDTALALKKVYLSLVDSGMFGPEKC